MNSNTFTFTANQITGLIKRDAVSEFTTLLDQEERIEAHLQQANQLIQRKCGSQMLHLCAQYNAHHLCQFILSHSLLPEDLINTRDSEGKTPLHVSCIFGAFECAKICLASGAQVDALKRGDWTALMMAVAKSDLELVQLLLNNGADLSLCNKDGWNCIHLATRTGNTAVLNLLEEHAKANDQLYVLNVKTRNGRSILHIAAMNSHVHLVKHFLESSFLIKGLEVNSMDVCGVTPFFDAARVDCVEICRLLYQNSQREENFNANQTDRSGRTALHMASQANATKAIEYLVKCLNCDIDQKDHWGQSAIFLAVREGHEAATKLLLQLGTKQLLDSKNRSLFELAKQYGHIHLFKYLS